MGTKEKVKKTPKQKGKKALKVILIIIAVIAVIAGIIALANVVSYKSNRNFIQDSIEQVQYDNQLKPSLGEDGYYTFVTDEDFKVVQITDVHLGGGVLSGKKDNMAINAVAAMITEEKPDLVIVTGDVAFPVPYAAATFNNKSSAVTFAQLMEKLGVYWCMAYGNHDTEAYSYFDRADISKIYESDAYPHCLFQRGPEDVDGYGNYVVNVKNTAGQITQSLFVIDSHAYTDGDTFGIMWRYDAIHENQVEWYKNTLAELTEENDGITPKSLAFFHIPLAEMKEAFNEYQSNGNQDTADVQYNYGKIAEDNLVICASEHNYGMFDAFLNSGSTQGIFFGHDHLNNMSLTYKGVRMTYGYSIDYLAYSGIWKFGLQRGCTVIDIAPDGSFDCHRENYYQDKYKSVNEKEEVDLDHEMSEVKDNAGTNPLLQQ